MCQNLLQGAPGAGTGKGERLHELRAASGARVSREGTDKLVPKRGAERSETVP